MSDQKSATLDQSLIPRIVIDENNNVVEKLIASAISGGMDYFKEMPRTVSLDEVIVPNGTATYIHQGYILEFIMQNAKINLEGSNFDKLFREFLMIIPQKSERIVEEYLLEYNSANQTLTTSLKVNNYGYLFASQVLIEDHVSFIMSKPWGVLMWDGIGKVHVILKDQVVLKFKADDRTFTVIKLATFDLKRHTVSEYSSLDHFIRNNL